MNRLYIHTYPAAVPGGTVVEDMPANVGDERDAVSIPGSGRSPGERDGYPLQYSYLKNSRDREE